MIYLVSFSQALCCPWLGVLNQVRAQMHIGKEEIVIRLRWQRKTSHAAGPK